MMRKTSLVFLGAMAGAVVTLLATQPHSLLIGSAARAAASDTYRELNLFGDVFERVRADYVEKPDDSKLVESAINGMLAGLDPHSSYMDPKSFRDMQVQTRGEFGATTFTRPSSMVTSMPSPPNSPRVCTFISLKFLAFR